MINQVLQLVIILFTATGGFLVMEFIFPYVQGIIESEIWKIGWLGVKLSTVITLLLGGLLGGVCGYLISPFFIRKFWKFTYWLEKKVTQMPTGDVVIGASGMIIGLILANLFGFAFRQLPFVGPYIPVILSVVLAYVGLSVAINKKEEVYRFFARVNWPKKKESANYEKHTSTQELKPLIQSRKILDTSVIIDGRIADLSRTGFLEGTLVLPQFVLVELQHIADSSDGLKRNRGRRGLDVLNLLQKEENMNVEIDSTDFEDYFEVDTKLVKLALKTGGKILTTDYNLNKVAELQGVKVLNINELSNAIKPVMIPGETMSVFVVKEGKESDQGIGYLDDGTMIVVESGRSLIGQTIDTAVTSVLQTAAGRMIFVRPK